MPDRSVTIRLKVSSSEFDAAMTKAGTEVRILAREIDGAGKNGGLDKVGTSAKNAEGKIRPLRDSILLLGPALIPVAGAALTLGAGLLGLGATGVLAFQGIKKEIADGTQVGQQYSAGLSVLKTDLGGLEQIAAAGVLDGFNRSVADAHNELPQLSGMVGDLSKILGDMTANTLHGVIGGFQTFEPLIQHVALYIDQLSARFSAWATGPGGAGFGKTLGSEFDQIMPVLENLISAAAKLIAAFAPVGNQIVGVIGLLASAIHALPVPVLTAMAAAFTALYAGNRLMVSSLPPVARTFGALGIAIYAAGQAINSYVEKNNSFAKISEHTSDIQGSFSAALLVSKGAIDDNVKSAAALQLAQSGLSDKALKAGISSDALTAGLTGTDAQFGKLVDTWKASGKPSGDTITALGLMRIALLGAEGDTKALAAATAAKTSADQIQANQMGVSLTAYQSATQAVQDQKDALQATTAQMQLENDAAGLLKQALDLLNGKAISAAEAQNAFDSSLVNMGDHVTATGKKVTFTTTSIKDMSSASVSLRGQLNSQITNLQNVVEANGGLANSTDAARTQMVNMRDQIIANAVAHGVDRAAVTAYIDSILKIPPKAESEAVFKQTAADKGIAAIRSALSGLNNTVAYPGVSIGGTWQSDLATIRSALANVGSSTYVPGISVKPKATGGAIGMAAGGIPGMAFAGAVIGPGSGTSDQAGIYRLSNGEHVLTDADVRAMGGQSSVYAFRDALHNARPVGPSASPGAGGMNPQVFAAAIVDALRRNPIPVGGVLTTDGQSLTASVSTKVAAGLR